MRQHPQLPLESDAYLQVMVAYNTAIAACLGCVFDSAAGYDEARERLARSAWPANAPQIAATYLAQFPELARLFTPRGPGKRLPEGILWDEVCRDVLNHEEYRRLVQARSHWYRTRIRQHGMELDDLYTVCLQRIIRLLIGRAVVWPVLLSAYRATHPHTTTTWLQFALNGARHEVDRSIREALGQVIRGHGAALLGTVPLNEQEEARNPQPDVLAEEHEYQRMARAALERLPAEDRELIENRGQGQTFPEIAAEMGLSRATVRQRYQQALARLRDDLGSSFGPDQ